MKAAGVALLALGGIFALALPRRRGPDEPASRPPAPSGPSRFGGEVVRGASGLRIFPVAGGAQYWDDFGQPRNNNRTHQGNDLFAAIGTPVVAVDDGVAKMFVDPLGGNAVSLVAPNGTRYYYAHLDRWARAAGDVAAGEVLGFVGVTGNARGTKPHLHFEVHPNGGAAVDPYPLLAKAERIAPPAPPAPPSSSSGGAFALAALGVGAVALLARGRA